MSLHRTSVKLFLSEPSVDLDAVIPVFHAWIQESKAAGMLIDVADYRHMIDGPGVVLIGHDVDYAIDLLGGRPGLLHTRKRDLHDELKAELPRLFHDALAAAKLLTEEPSLGNPAVATNEAALTLLDRLHAPNTAEAFEQIRPDVQAFADALFGEQVELSHASTDARQPLTIHIKAKRSPGLEALLENCGAKAG